MTKKGRGPTRGKGLEKINKAAKTKMPIEICKEKGRPLDATQSSKLSSELGIISRRLIPVPTKWKALKDEDKQVAFDRLATRFEIKLDEAYVKEDVEALLKSRSKEERYRLHQRFLMHPTIEDARKDPPNHMTQENWDALCNYFADPAYQKRCEMNKNNRAKQTITHNQGSKPFVVARHEKRDMVTGEEPDRITFYEHTHYSDKGWTCPEAQSQFKEMENMKSQSTIDGGTPMSVDEIADRVLGTRPGYIKGLGHGPKPKTSISLKRRNAELEEALRDFRRDNEILREQLKAREAEAMTQNETIENIIAKQVEYDKFVKSVIATGLVSSTTSTP